MTDGARRVADGGTWLPLAAVAAIALLDLVAGLRAWPVPVAGLLDEPAHLMTAWLLLTALRPATAPPWSWWPVLLASVAIDVDHLPIYATGGGFVVDGGRPPTHSLATVAVLVVLGLAGQRTRWALGAAVGVLLHFVRDLATGPGIPALWPVLDTGVRVPYWVYSCVVVGAALVAVGRRTAALRPGGAGRAGEPRTS